MVRIVPQHHPFHDQHEGAVQAQQGGDQHHPRRAEGPGVPAEAVVEPTAGGGDVTAGVGRGAGGGVCGGVHRSIVERGVLP
ncbi:hypothetical protein ACFFX0_02340 [Citricoccus parietis]|uniref:Uncharacterized protein n=1 Tax=Citricoccus parietis TaxID=592307 RepID=A0ABV5FTU1_9MICC